MIKSMPAREFLEFIHGRDFPQEEHSLSPSVDDVQVVWDNEQKCIALGPDANGDTIPMTQEAWEQLAWIIGIHKSIPLKVPANALPEIINARLKITDQLFLNYALLDGEHITSWITGGTKPVLNTVLLDKIAHKFGLTVDDLEVWHISDSPDLTRYNILIPHYKYQAKLSPVPWDNEHVLPGIAVQNSASWAKPFRLGIYLHHTRSANGSIGSWIADNYARRRTPEGQDAWVNKSLASLYTGMDSAVKRLAHLRNIEITDRLEAFAQSLFIDMKYPMDMKTATDKALMNNPMNTMYDAWHIVAGMGSELAENRWLTDHVRYRIMEIANRLADQPDRCPSCFRLKI